MNVIRKIVSLRKENKIEMGDKMVPIKKINPIEKNIIEHKKIQELENSKKEFNGRFAKQISKEDMQRIFQHSGVHIGKSGMQTNQKYLETKFPVPPKGFPINNPLVSNTNKSGKNRLYGQLQNKIMEQRNNIALTKGVVPDPRKRQFIKKGILGIIAGVGIAVFSKMTRAVQSINFNDGTTAFDLETAGNVTMPNQPYVVAKATSQANVTGAGTTDTVTFATEIQDRVNDFSSPTFTAPVTAGYQVGCNVWVVDLTESALTDIRLSCVTSNRTYFGTVLRNTSGDLVGMGEVCLVFSEVVEMDASDTLTITVQASGMAGDTADINANSYLTIFQLG